MHTRLSTAWLLAAGMASLVFATVSTAADPTVQTLYDRVQMVTFHSSILGSNKNFCVVLPENYDPSVDNWPVLFFLHGNGRTERSLVDVQSKRESLKAGNFVTILPDGDSSWWINSPYGNYGAYLDETIALAESMYGLSTDARSRAITGWSMGGYGAVRYAESHSDGFSSVSSIIGVIDYPRDQSDFDEDQRYPIREDIFTNNPNNWPAKNPINFVENLSDMSIQLITGNESFDRTMNENFSARLTELNIDHSLTILEGSHSFDVTLENAIPLVVSHTNAIFSEGPPGDFNGDGVVDAADFTVWRKNLGTNFGLSGNGNETGASLGVVDQADYLLWRAHYGEEQSGPVAASGTSAAPEPAGLMLAAAAMLSLSTLVRKR